MSAEEAEAARAEAAGAHRVLGHAGVDPAIMGTGPIPASRKALEKAGWTVGDLDLVESNEAFAAQSLRGARPGLGPGEGERQRRRHRHRPPDRRVRRADPDDPAARDEARGRKKGLATLCVGGGMGVAMCVERSETVRRRRTQPATADREE